MQTDSDNQTGTKPKGGIGVVQIDLRAMKSMSTSRWSLSPLLMQRVLSLYS